MTGFGVPIGAGDNALTTRHEFAAMIDRGRIDIVQPDVALAGGYSEAREIAALVNSCGRRMIYTVTRRALRDAINAAFMSWHQQDDFIEFALTDLPLRYGLIEELFEV